MKSFVRPVACIVPALMFVVGLCVHLRNTPLSVTAPTPPLRFLQDARAEIVGNNGRGPFPLGLCQGDCDRDEDCRDGLVCHKRRSGDDAPGCYLDSRRRQSRADFCVKKGMLEGGGGDSNGGGSYGQDDFLLKLYWELGYFWQEERVERRWCMQCRGRCRPGNMIRIVRCRRDRPTRWRFIHYDNVGREVQIQVSGRPLCMEVERSTNEVYLAPCNPFEEKQRFIAQDGNFLNSYRFEIMPKTKLNWCLTQRHHPKQNEIIKIERCIPTRLKSDTSHWNKYDIN